MAGRYQNERILEYGQETTILGGTVHQTGDGRDQNEKFGNESGRRTTRSLLRHVVR